MQIIAPMFFITLVMIAVTIFATLSPDANIGCYVLGAEVNGDYSTEYLMVGRCL
jgi:hypothetical protein